LLELEFALLAIVMCLVVSHANTYYFVFALPALSVALAAVIERPAALGPPFKVAGCGDRVVGIPRAPAYGAMLAAGLMVELHRIYRARIDSPPQQAV